MTTTCAIGRLDTDSGEFTGRYVDTGGHPADMGPTLAALIDAADGDLHTVLDTLVTRHSAWHLVATAEALRAMNALDHDYLHAVVVPHYGVAFPIHAGSRDELDMPRTVLGDPHGSTMDVAWFYAFTGTDADAELVVMDARSTERARFPVAALAELPPWSWQAIECGPHGEHCTHPQGTHTIAPPPTTARELPTTPAAAADLVLDLIPDLLYRAHQHGSTVTMLRTALGSDHDAAEKIISVALRHQGGSDLVCLYLNDKARAEAMSTDREGWVAVWPLDVLDVPQDVHEHLAVTDDGILTDRHHPDARILPSTAWITTRQALARALPAIVRAAEVYRDGGSPEQAHPAVAPAIDWTPRTMRRHPAGSESEAAALILTLLPALFHVAKPIDQVVHTVADYLAVHPAVATTLVNRAAGDPAQGELLRFRLTAHGTALPVSHAERGPSHEVVAMADAGYPADTEDRLTITAAGRVRTAPGTPAAPGTDWIVTRTALDHVLTEQDR